ncbi:MAG: hypothetical protein ACFFCS_20590 [Candidatus Hodarchaeota archaeon]
MIDAIYILREDGIRFLSDRYVNQDDTGTLDDMVTGFFSALEHFSNNTFNENIDHVHFKTGSRLVFKDFKLSGGTVIKFVILTSPTANEKDANRIVTAKSIELKWALEKLVQYIASDAVPPESVKEEIKEKIRQIFNA